MFGRVLNTSLKSQEGFTGVFRRHCIETDRKQCYNQLKEQSEKSYKTIHANTFSNSIETFTVDSKIIQLTC